MKKENWRGRNKTFGERSKSSGSLRKGKGDTDLSSFPVLPSALFARQLFLFFSSCFCFFCSFTLFSPLPTLWWPQAVIFSRNVFFLNEFPLKMCQTFERSVSDNSPILLTSYTERKFKVDTTKAVLVCTVGRD